MDGEDGQEEVRKGLYAVELFVLVDGDQHEPQSEGGTEEEGSALNEERIASGGGGTDERAQCHGSYGNAKGAGNGRERVLQVGNVNTVEEAGQLLVQFVQRGAEGGELGGRRRVERMVLETLTRVARMAVTFTHEPTMLSIPNSHVRALCPPFVSVEELFSKSIEDEKGDGG